MQMPPMVSAVKKDGVPLYKLARKGIEVERKARLVHVYNFRFSDYHEPVGRFRVACTKGTYVRSLAHELGQKLGCGAHLATLRRMSSGKVQRGRCHRVRRGHVIVLQRTGKASHSLLKAGSDGL